MAASARSQPARPLMVDVARRAGVSHQTVSRVLNNHPNVRPQTRAGVLAAIRDLGYRPNAAARTLVTGRTNALGVISFDTTLYGPASMLYGIERAARPGYSVAIASLQAFDRPALLDAVERLLDQGVEGIIVIAPVTTAVAALSGLAPNIPLVAVGCLADVPLPSVAIDNNAGAAQATQHLLSLGHETVYHVAGPKTWLDAQQRIAGWRDALRAAQAAEPDLLRGDWSARSGYELGQQLSGMPDVTAVLCGNDSMALGVLRAFAESGRKVPDDVSVVGFDDIAEAPYFLPPLTTVRQDFGELGRRALHLLIEHIDHGQPPGPLLPISPDLVIRASTAPRLFARDRRGASPRA
ncbi:MAG: LacI family DNA-binding transcriptional regulator [Streptosporangiaceae bacterium]